MKTITFFLICFIEGMFITVPGQTPDLKKLSENIVTKTIHVKPGDQVTIFGNSHFLDLMEELAIQTNEAGGIPTIIIHTDNLLYSKWHNLPVEYLKFDNKAGINAINSSKYVISLPPCHNCKWVYSNISEEKMQYIYPSQEQIKAFNECGAWQYHINYPVKEDAPSYGFTPEEFESMHWKALDSDYSVIARRCQILNDLFVKGKKLTITCPAGTNFSVNLAANLCMLNDGIITDDEVNSKTISHYISLPTGNIAVFPNSGTGNGVLISVNDYSDVGPLFNVEGKIKNGMLVSMKADKGSEFISKLFSEMNGNRGMLGEIIIGVNPDLKVGKEPSNFIWEAEGLVMVGFGNTIYTNYRTDSGGVWYFPILNATVKIDGEEIIRNGKLVIKNN